MSEKCCSFIEDDAEGCSRLEEEFKGEDLKGRCNNNRECYYSENGECGTSSSEDEEKSENNSDPSSNENSSNNENSNKNDKKKLPASWWLEIFLYPFIIALLFVGIILLYYKLLYNYLPYTSGRDLVQVFLWLLFINYISISLFLNTGKLDRWGRREDELHIEGEFMNERLPILLILLTFVFVTGLYKWYLIRYFSTPPSEIRKQIIEHVKNNYELSDWGQFKIYFWRSLVGLTIIPSNILYLIFGSSQKIYLPITTV